MKRMQTIITITAIAFCYNAHAQKNDKLLSPEAAEIISPKSLFETLDQKIRESSLLLSKLMSAKNKTELEQISNDIKSVNAQMNLIHEKINEIVIAARQRIVEDTTTLEAIEKLQQELSKKKIR